MNENENVDVVDARKVASWVGKKKGEREEVGAGVRLCVRERRRRASEREAGCSDATASDTVPGGNGRRQKGSSQTQFRKEKTCVRV